MCTLLPSHVTTGGFRGSRGNVNKTKKVSGTDSYYIQGESKKRVISKNMAITTLKSIRKGKIGVYWKIHLKCCRIGTKPFKIGGKMAKKNELEVGNPPLN